MKRAICLILAAALAFALAACTDEKDGNNDKGFETNDNGGIDLPDVPYE